MRIASLKVVLFSALVATSPMSAIAQTVIDGTEVGLEDIMPRLVSALQDELRDPFSARLRRLSWVVNDGICGEVNAKNAFGAYVGFTRFYLSGFDGTVTIMPADPQPIDEFKLIVIQSACDIVGEGVGRPN